MGDTPSYIKSLLMPTAKPQVERRAWSIGLQQVWIPFFLSTNTMGDTAIPHDALGSPLRLAFDKDGAVKFSRAGRPVVRIAKPIADSIRLVRDNFTANLQQYAHKVATERKEDYQAQVKMAIAEGEPIATHDRAELDKAVKLQVEQAIQEAEAKAKAEKLAVEQAEAEQSKASAKREAVKV